MSSRQKKALSLFSMIKIKDAAIELMPGYLMIEFPVKLNFSHFKKRIGPEKFDNIFHVYDGTLSPTFANYKGCNYACKKCRSIALKKDFLKSLRYRIITLLNHPEKITLGKERRSFAISPKDNLPSCVKKRPTFPVLSFCFLPKEEDQEQ